MTNLWLACIFICTEQTRQWYQYSLLTLKAKRRFSPKCRTVNVLYFICCMSVPPLEGKQKIWSHGKRILTTSQECKITVIKIVCFSTAENVFPHSSSMNTQTCNYWAQGEVLVSSLVFFHVAGVVLINLVASRDAVSCGRLSCCSLSVQTMRRQSSGMKSKHQSQHSDWLNQTLPISPIHPALQWNRLLICIVLLFYVLSINTLFSLLVSSLFSENIYFLSLYFCPPSSFALWQPERFNNIPFHFTIKIGIHMCCF